MIKLVGKFLISVLIIVLLLGRTDFSSVFARMKTVDPALLFSAACLLLALVIPQTIRWQSIIRASEANLKFRPAVGTTLVGWFFNQALPSSVGGDAFRVWYAYRFGIRLGTATQSVIFDRISGLLGVMMLLVFCSPWLSRIFTSSQPVIGVLVFAFALLLGSIGVLTADRLILFLVPVSLRQRLVELCTTARRVFLGRTGVRVIALSVVIHLTVATAVWLLARSMQIPLELVHSLLLMPVILFVSAIPISIAGWGVREGTSVLVFGMVGMPAESAISLSLSFGLVMLVTGLPGGVVWWFMHHEIPPES
jgi:uncharacterized protein (TIRG00374 family)